VLSLERMTEIEEVDPVGRTMTVQAGAVLAAMLSGFGLSVVLYLLPDAPGDVAERLLPFLVALAVLWLGRSKQVLAQ